MLCVLVWCPVRFVDVDFLLGTVHPTVISAACKLHGVVSGSSTPDSSTRDSSTIYALQLLIASHKQFRGGSGGRSPPVLAFSLGVWGLVSQEYDVLVFSV